MENKEEIDKNKSVKEEKNEEYKNTKENNLLKKADNIADKLKKIFDGEAKQDLDNKYIETKDLKNENNISNNKDTEQISDIKNNDNKEVNIINKKKKQKKKL